MNRRSIKAYCKRCKHTQPFVRARFNTKFHAVMILATLGVWIIGFLSALIRHIIWPRRCEHCSWHEPDYRSPEERARDNAQPVQPGMRRKNSGMMPQSQKADPKSARPAAQHPTPHFGPPSGVIK